MTATDNPASKSRWKGKKVGGDGQRVSKKIAKF
jgi:hypothetical protein